jgi:hypothetical protein
MTCVPGRAAAAARRPQAVPITAAWRLHAWRQSTGGGCPCRPLAAMPQEGVRSALQDMASWRSGKLMTFDSANAHVRAHFSEALVVLLREVSEWAVGGAAGRRRMHQVHRPRAGLPLRSRLALLCCGGPPSAHPWLPAGAAAAGAGPRPAQGHPGRGGRGRQVLQVGVRARQRGMQQLLQRPAARQALQQRPARAASFDAPAAGTGWC